MIVIIGSIIVLGSVLGGFMMAGGNVGALLHLSEWVIIGGAAWAH
jgi:chemotaxis protein MotA